METELLNLKNKARQEKDSDSKVVGNIGTHATPDKKIYANTYTKNRSDRSE